MGRLYNVVGVLLEELVARGLLAEMALDGAEAGLRGGHFILEVVVCRISK